MQGLGASRKIEHVGALGVLGDRIEQAPGVAGHAELGVRGSAVFLEDVRHVGGVERAGVEKLDGEIMGLGVGQFALLVTVDAGLQGVPALGELADHAGDDLGEIAFDEAGMAAGQLDLAVEGEVVTDEDLIASGEGRREGLVVGVAHAQHPRVALVLGIHRLDGEEAEVAEPAVTLGDGVGFAGDAEAGLDEVALDFIEQAVVGHRAPRLGGSRGVDDRELVAIHAGGTGVEAEFEFFHSLSSFMARRRLMRASGMNGF